MSGGRGFNVDPVTVREEYRRRIAALEQTIADLRRQLQASAETNARMSREIAERDAHHQARVKDFESLAQAHKERAERLDGRCEDLERQLAEARKAGKRLENMIEAVDAALAWLEPPWDEDCVRRAIDTLMDAHDAAMAEEAEDAE